jgi:small subunit ribosomal protein S2
MANVTMKELLEAGVHFGHETKRWDPRMKPYIFGARNGIYIIDLQKTVQLFKEAYEFIRNLVAQGEYILFVGTKKQAQETIHDQATRCGMFYVNYRWLGGMLTNFQTIKRSIDRLNKLEAMKNEEIYNLLPKKEVLQLEKERIRLDKSLGGIKNMDRLPGTIFVVDPKKERIAIKEARKISIPSIGIVDTNCNPEEVDYIIPGNDDAIRAIHLFSSKVADAVIEGRQLYEKQLQTEKAKEEKQAIEPIESLGKMQVEQVEGGIGLDGDLD